MNSKKIIQKKRLTKEFNLLKEDPLSYCTAYPDENNHLIWYFLIIGQKGTDYHGGEYIGRIEHNENYPIEPPNYYMMTPSGRYTTNSKICLTNSSYHRGDWSSTWNIKSILIAFYSIWIDDTEHGISHIKESSAERKKKALESIEYNKRNHSAIYAKFDRTNLTDDADNILKKQPATKSTKNDINNETKPSADALEKEKEKEKETDIVETKTMLKNDVLKGVDLDISNEKNGKIGEFEKNDNKLMMEIDEEEPKIKEFNFEKINYDKLDDDNMLLKKFTNEINNEKKNNNKNGKKNNKKYY